jgi:hypothetical protein
MPKLLSRRSFSDRLGDAVPRALCPLTSAHEGLGYGPGPSSLRPKKGGACAMENIKTTLTDVRQEIRDLVERL